MNDIEAQLRSTLTERAGHAPSGDELAGRIVAAAESPVRGNVLRPRHGWHTWTMPLLAAGAVATVVAAVVGIDHVRDSASPPAVPHVVPTMTPTQPVAPSPFAGPTSAPSSPSTPKPTTSPTVNPVYVTGFHAEDVTFASADHGWAVGSADCVRGAGRCSALFRTTDGTHWSSMPGTQFNLPDVKNCAAPCVEHIRFATDLIGYAYGPDVLFMTVDGGLHWAQQKGLGADALETLGGNVIAVRAIDVTSSVVERATVGSPHWTPVDVGPFPASTVTVGLARSGHSVVLEAISYNPAKGYLQPAALYRSPDNGMTWSKVGEPCPAIGAGYSDNSTAVTMAGDGSVVVDCAGRDKAQTALGGRTITSSNGGKTFATPSAGGKLAPAQLLAAASHDDQFVVVYGKLYRSHDAGDSWTPVTAITGAVTFLGFESSMVGRAVTDGGRKIWTTRDAGRTWAETDFP